MPRLERGFFIGHVGGYGICTPKVLAFNNAGSRNNEQH